MTTGRGSDFFLPTLILLLNFLGKIVLLAYSLWFPNMGHYLLQCNRFCLSSHLKLAHFCTIFAPFPNIWRRNLVCSFPLSYFQLHHCISTVQPGVLILSTIWVLTSRYTTSIQDRAWTLRILFCFHKSDLNTTRRGAIFMVLIVWRRPCSLCSSKNLHMHPLSWNKLGCRILL